MTETATDLTVDIEALAIEREELEASLEKSRQSYESRTKAKRDRLAEVEAQIAKSAPAGDSEHGSKAVRVTHLVSPDKAKLAENYPQDEYPELWKSEIQASKVKAKFGEDEYSRYQVPTGKTKITVHDTI